MRTTLTAIHLESARKPIAEHGPTALGFGLRRFVLNHVPMLDKHPIETRTMFVVTKAHEKFYNDELSDAPGSNLVVQPANRGTGVAVATAVLQILQHDPDAIVAFFPSDHYFADDAGFQATVGSAITLARQRPESLILVGAPPRWPEVEYGWIEPGSESIGADGISVRRVARFWEKPPLGTAVRLMRDGGLWIRSSPSVTRTLFYIC